jgi:diaminohydroxyphosphoribosylaminopyrimidine deaminase/5-amino-6-(5-phosphoribosylamino)uracil reductase
LNPYNLKEFFDFCYTEEIQSVIVEGGQKTLQGFIDQNLWDEARVFQSEKKIKKGIPAPVFNKEATNTEFINGDQLNSYFN